jgi:protein-S-isoprenylcysteine O-methyltransferase Ste14
MRLFYFLRDGGVRVGQPNYVLDAVLALQFGVAHSLLLAPPVRQRITRVLPSALYGTLFCTATCLGLLLMVAGWQASAAAMWELEGAARAIVQFGFLASWGMMFYGMSLTGLGYQSGFTPWWHWLKRTPVPRREFQRIGAFHILRHPTYLGFLGLIWFTPRMTLDHVILTGVWTAYVFVGSYLKDERLAKYIGEPYREFMAQVPGYPLIGFGPLGRRPQTVKSIPGDHSMGAAIGAVKAG